MVTWEQDFDFYLAELDDKPASFVIDLNAAAAAPMASHPLRLSIRVPMLRPREDGLRDAGELDDLGALEDQFVEALAEKVDAIYVGRMVHDGNTDLYLYVPEAHRDALEDLPALTGAPPGDYVPQWDVVEEPGWDLYTEFLFPDEYAHQSIWNRRLLNVFSENGDQLEVAREIDHNASFPSREAAEAAAAALRAAGFAVDEIGEPGEDGDDDEADDSDDGLADGDDGDDDAALDDENAMGGAGADAEEDDGDDDASEASADDDDADDGDDDDDDEVADDDDDADEADDDDDADEADDDADADGDDEPDDDAPRWSLEFHRDDALADGRPDEFVAEILDIILPLGGSYDGWGAEGRPAAAT
jgi:hypothetical protein